MPDAAVAPARPDARGSVAGAGFLAVLAGALALRLGGLGSRSLWTDEGSTWTATSGSLAQLIRLCAEKDASPPLFYLLTWVALWFGDGEVQLRIVSVLASLGMVWITYRIVRLYAGRNEATLAAALVAVSPFQVMYAQEARTYMLVACLSAWSFYLFLRAVVFDQPRAWLPFMLVSALALYTQSIAVLGFGVQAAVVLFHKEARQRLLVWLVALGVALLLYLPWVFVTMGQMSRLGHSHWYLEPPTDHGVFQVARSVLLSPVPLVTSAEGAPHPGLSEWMPRPLAWGLLLVAIGVPLLAAARRALARGTAAATQRILWAALLLPPIVVFVASSRTPLFLPRYFVLLSPFLACLLAHGLRAIRPPAAGVAATVLVLAAYTYGCVRYHLDYSKERWRDVAAEVARVSDPARTAVLVPFDADPFRYYNVRLDRPFTVVEVSHPDVPFSSGYTGRQIDEMERAAASRVAGYDDVWVVVRSPNSDVRQEVARRSDALAATGRRLAGRWRWDAVNGPLRVARYVR